MSMLITLSDRDGEVAGPTEIFNIKPSIGEKVSFYTKKGKFLIARVVDVSYHVPNAPRSRGCDVRVYVLLDLPKEAFDMDLEITPTPMHSDLELNDLWFVFQGCCLNKDLSISLPGAPITIYRNYMRDASKRYDGYVMTHNDKPCVAIRTVAEAIEALKEFKG